MEVYPVPEGLDGRDDAGRKRAPGHNLEIPGQGPEGAAAEVPQKPTLVLEEDPQPLTFSLIERGGPGDFRRFWRLERHQGDIPALSTRP